MAVVIFFYSATCIEAEDTLPWWKSTTRDRKKSYLKFPSFCCFMDKKERRTWEIWEQSHGALCYASCVRLICSLSALHCCALSVVTRPDLIQSLCTLFRAAHDPSEKRKACYYCFYLFHRCQGPDQTPLLHPELPWFHKKGVLSL